MLSKCSVLIVAGVGVFVVSGCAREVKCVPGQVAAAPSAQQAASGPVKVVRVTLTPPNAVVLVHGERIDHPPGYIDLPGPVGYVFNIEVVGIDSSISRQVTVTASGAEPAQLALLPPAPVVPPAKDPVTSEMLAATLADPYGTPPAPPPPRQAAPPSDADATDLLAAAMGPDSLGSGGTALTVMCVPACAVIDNGVSIGTSPLVNHVTAPGRHVLRLTSANGVTKTLVVSVAASTTKSIRVAMDDGGGARKPASRTRE